MKCPYTLNTLQGALLKNTSFLARIGPFKGGKYEKIANLSNKNLLEAS